MPVSPEMMSQAGQMIGMIPTPVTTTIGTVMQVMGALGGARQANIQQKQQQMYMEMLQRQKQLESKKKMRNYLIYGSIGIGVIGLGILFLRRR